MESSSLGLYVAASLALIATPGQDMLYVISRSLAQGRFAGLCSALGVCLGILVHTALAALGVGAILRANESLFIALKIAGAAYLVYLGLRMLLQQPGAAAAAASEPPLAPLALVAQGVLSNVSNPKMVVFFMAFLPQFVDPSAPHATRQLVLLGALYAAMALPVKGAVALAAGAFASRARQSQRAMSWMNRAGGAILVLLGMRLVAGGNR